MQDAKIYPQARKIRNESLDFVDGPIEYDEIEDDAFGDVIDGLSRENQVLFGFPESSVKE